VVVNLFDLPGRPEVREACVANVLTAKADCERYGMPLMVEPLVMKDATAGGYTSDGTTAKIVPLVRQAVELGADVIKADPTDDTDDYHQVVQAAGASTTTSCCDVRPQSSSRVPPASSTAAT
jgi:DhnA family fructose-bisphosphate aldolase class Ia